MLNKIILIKNVGRFCNFERGGDTAFAKWSDRGTPNYNWASGPTGFAPARSASVEERIIMSDHPYKEAGRRLKAALISYRLGRAGVDRTLKQIPDDPGEGWAELAQELDRRMAEQVMAPFSVRGFGPPTIQ